MDSIKRKSNNMLKKIFLTLLLALVLPATAFASADLRIEGEDIRFSKSPLVAGDQVRIYAKIFNNGDEDISGYATFFQGNTVVADSQVISVIAGGSPEEVYVDFIVPSSSFNLRAEIRGTDPVDENLANNTAITGLFTPILDDDRDGVENSKDNCVSNKNPDQVDTDGDGKGNVCDDDDDNDGLSDAVEAELGSSPVSSDTDGDGALDPDDAYPIDPTKTVIEIKKPEPPKVEKKTEVEKAISKIVEDIKLENDSVEVPEPVLISEPINVQEISELKLSPNAIFSYKRDSWDTFTFKVQAAGSDSVSYEWSFGDGVKSGKDTVTHSFRRPGAYTVTLNTMELDGSSSKESTVILIPFFSLENNVVMLAVIMLVLLLLVGLSLLVAISRKQKTLKMYDEIEHENFDDLDDEEDDEIVVKKAVKKPSKKIRVKESE